MTAAWLQVRGRGGWSDGGGAGGREAQGSPRGNTHPQEGGRRCQVPSLPPMPVSATGL
jgi:hypothetical protein